MPYEEKLFCELVNYFMYLEYNKKSYHWNIGYFKKLKKLLQAFGHEYIKNRWGVN